MRFICSEQPRKDRDVRVVSAMAAHSILHMLAAADHVVHGDITPIFKFWVQLMPGKTNITYLTVSGHKPHTALRYTYKPIGVICLYHV